MAATSPAQSAVEVQAADLPLYCPNPAMPLWSSHPRVYLEMGEENFVECSYCDRRFVLVHALPESEELAPGTYEGAGGH